MLGGVWFFIHSKPQSLETKICITQITDHPSLDKIRKSLISCLEDNLSYRVKIHYQSAQGNITTAAQIARQFVNEKPAVIIPITTPSAQTVFSVAKGTGIPVIFSAVSDPEAAKLTQDITGIQDAPPIKEQIDLIKKLCPALKTIGFLYNPSEANSVAALKLFKRYAKDIDVVEGALVNTHQIGEVTKAVSSRVQAFYIPNDNTAISHFETIVRIAHRRPVPVFTSDPESVERGALATVAIDQESIGIDTAHLVLKVLKEKKLPPIQQCKNTKTIINVTVAKNLNIAIPKDVRHTSVK